MGQSGLCHAWRYHGGAVPHSTLGSYPVQSDSAGPALSRAVVEEAFVGNPALQLLGPYNGGDARTAAIRVRLLQPVPFQYTRYFLQDCTPRQDLEDLFPIIDANGNGVP